MGEAKVYSERLGRISDAQFEAVAERLGLGRFLKAEPTTSGLFGQNVFVTTTEGEFVLRGAPHWVKGLGEKEWRREDRWQFTKEVFFARQLHEQTQGPGPLADAARRKRRHFRLALSRHAAHAGHLL